MIEALIISAVTTLCAITDAQRNFALEQYGSSSVCLYHDQEWTERTCHQMRTWQHWGSGCYSYTCRDNRLQIIVANHTYTCYHAQQVRSSDYAVVSSVTY